MTDFKLYNFDINGNLTHVHTDDGFMQTSRPFNPEQD